MHGGEEKEDERSADETERSTVELQVEMGDGEVEDVRGVKHRIDRGRS